MASDSASRFHQIPEALWERIDLVIPIYNRSCKGGRPRLSMQNVVGGILYVLATGCQWKAMPNQLKGIDWKWQSMDGAMTKSPLGGEKNREKPDRSWQAGRQAVDAHRRLRRADRRHAVQGRLVRSAAAR